MDPGGPDSVPLVFHVTKCKTTEHYLFQELEPEHFFGGDEIDFDVAQLRKATVTRIETFLLACEKDRERSQEKELEPGGAKGRPPGMVCTVLLPVKVIVKPEGRGCWK